jgi:AcrR family transcriptional regulator
MNPSEAVASPPRRSGRPSRDAADLLTGHVVECAARLFIRRGYAGTAIEAVAAEAKVGKNTIYRRYAGKSDLFEAVVDQQMRAILPPIETITAHADPREALRDLAIDLVEAALKPETAALQRLMIAEAERFPEVAAICIERAYKPAIATARAVLERAMPDGTGAAQLEFVAEQFVASLAYGPHLYALLGRRDLTSRQEIARYVDRALALFLGGWTSEGYRAAASPAR